MLGTLKNIGILDESFRLLATPVAVISGITYNFLPFVVLPLYVALERINPKLIEAAEDLYASRTQAFLRVTLPLSISGVFAASLLSFIPAVGDYLNAELLGSRNETMIGNVIQRLYLVNNDYPQASALSLILMAGIVVGVILCAASWRPRNLPENRDANHAASPAPASSAALESWRSEKSTAVSFASSAVSSTRIWSSSICSAGRWPPRMIFVCIAVPCSRRRIAVALSCLRS